MKVKVGEKCLTCKYWGSHTRSCSFILVECHSRLRDKDGNKGDPNYCDKYVQGKPFYEMSLWAKEGRVKRK